MKYFFFILAATLLLHACSGDFFSQTVNIDPPEYEKQLSFHLLLDTKDSFISLVMTRNYGILENIERYEDWFVKGATAELYENGQKWVTFTPLNADSTFVLTAVLPHPFMTGNTYEIRAAHPDFPSVSAVQVVPAEFQADSARVKFDAVAGEFGDRLDLAEIFLRDDPNVKNYYEIKLLRKYEQYIYDPFTGGYDTLLNTYPLSIDGFNDPNIKYGYENGGLVSDQFFNGQSYKFQARFYGDVYSGADSTIIVSVRSITEDYYKWSYSFEANDLTEENPLVEPTIIYHNLNNGLGIFSVAQRRDFIVN